MKNNIHNIRFRNKIILIFLMTFLFSTGAGSLAYYRYMEQEMVENFQRGSENVMVQMVDVFSTKMKGINNRAKGMLMNLTFVTGMEEYLHHPSEINIIKTMGMVSDFLKDLESGEPLIDSSYIYTDKGEFDNFVKMRNWDFKFLESPFYQVYKKDNGSEIQWFPAMEDQIFKGKKVVIPCVWRFSVPEYAGKQYLIFQIERKKVEEILNGKYQFFDKIVVLDQNGKMVAGSENLDGGQLQKLFEKEQAAGQIACKDYIHKEVAYLVTYGEIPENGWQIYGLRSRESLLESLKKVRSMLWKIATSLLVISLAMILWFSHQLTDALRRLEKRMSYVQNGDLNVRFFYPYHDEIGSLAKSFNYMIGEIQKLVRQQEETIEELKIQRDHMAEMQKQKRKAELRALQAQINPHFLYNTLNAITWQAADQGAEEVSILSNSLGKFFRLSLSRGAEVISLGDELEHVSSYLDIQSIRYRSQICYEIPAPMEWNMCRIIKLVLQPLAENSIYHGIKEKGGAGNIKISAQKEQRGDTWVVNLIVWDDGTGIPKGKLDHMNASLAKGETDRNEGYGIYNVNERIKLYYGEAYGLYYESEEGKWTRAILTIPFEGTEREEK